MQLKSINLIILLVSLLLVQDIKAQFLCGLFDKCTSSSEEPGVPTTNVSSASSTTSMTSTTSSAPAVLSSSSVVSSSSSMKPTSSSVQPVTSSSPTPSSKERSREPSAEPTEETSMTSDNASSTRGSKAPTLPSESASTTPSKQDKSTPHNSNIGVIVGSVCGFVAIIGAGFAYAFFSKTRRNNRRNKRLNSENGHLYGNQNSDTFENSRLSPVLAPPVVTAVDGNYNNQRPWEMAEQQSYGYSNVVASPQPPTAAVATQHDVFYTSQMGYAVDYNRQACYDTAYHDPNFGYQQQEYDHYNQQYGDPHAVQHQQSPAVNTKMAPLPTTPIATTSSNVYQTPHSYPDENHQPSTTNYEGSYR